jgi:hypothetical protein
VDRVLSLFGLYDILGYLLSGLALLLGIWWAVAGEIPEPSTTGLLGLLAGGYAAGQLASVAGRAWEDRWWRWKGRPGDLMIEGIPSPADEDQFEVVGKSVGEQIEREVGIDGLSADLRLKLAHAKLRKAQSHSRADAMRALHGLCRNLAASCALVGVIALAVVAVHGSEPRLWIAAGLAPVAGFLFGSRAIRYQWRFSREVLIGVLALRMP